MSIVRQVIGWGEGCYWNLRLKAGFETACSVRVGGFVRCKCDSGGFAGGVPVQSRLRVFAVLPRLEREMNRGAKGRRRARLLPKAAEQQSTGTRLLQRLLLAGTPDLRLILPGSGLL